MCHEPYQIIAKNGGGIKKQFSTFVLKQRLNFATLKFGQKSSRQRENAQSKKRKALHFRR